MLTLSGISVRYGVGPGRPAVDGVDLVVAERGVVAVLGPSGSGKSTLLRAVAGLEPLAAGTVGWGEEDLTDVAAHRRDFGLMFQDHALFPHRDVQGNVEFGLRMHGLSAEDRRSRVAEVLDLVGLAGFGSRTVDTLSGGEAQRVALARTLAPRPRLVMLDEPLGALDRDLRDRLVGELRLILGRAGVPALYVTHDHGEAFAIADAVAVMRDGRFVQVGSPEALWDAPADEWVAGFLGFGAAVDGLVVGAEVDTVWGRLPIARALGDGAVRIVVRPGGWRIDPAGPIDATATSCTFRGDRWEVRAEVAAPVVPGHEEDAPPIVLWNDAPIEAGDGVRLAVSPVHVIVLPPPLLPRLEGSPSA